jgi:hypothetical protein
VGTSASIGLIQQSCKKYCEWFYVLIYACRLKCCHIVASSVNGNDGPLVSRAATGVKMPDALQLAAALGAGCTTFVTNDRRIPAIRGIRVLQLGDYAT